MVMVCDHQIVQSKIREEIVNELKVGGEYERNVEVELHSTTNAAYYGNTRRTSN